jgi:transcriptional regulator with XRE-family HTH domain
VTGDFRESGRDGAVGEVEPALRGGGLPLPGLKHWRLRRRLSQVELARRAGLRNDHLFKIESGRRGCNPETAQLLADLLKVNLQDLRRKYDDALETKVPPRPARPRIAYRHVHQAYLKILLDWAVGSAYAAIDEWEIEKHCEKSTWEGVLEAVWARKREIEFLRGVDRGWGSATRPRSAHGGALVLGGGARELPRAGHPPAGGPKTRAFRGGAAGAHEGHAGSALTLFLPHADRFRSL